MWSRLQGVPSGVVMGDGQGLKVELGKHRSGVRGQSSQLWDR